MRKLLTEVN